MPIQPSHEQNTGAAAGSADHAKRENAQPAKQAIARNSHMGTGAGRGGRVPPLAHRFKPGRSGNPAGRPKAGASFFDWLNVSAGWTKPELVRAGFDPNAPAAKRAAAMAWLVLINGAISPHPDLPPIILKNVERMWRRIQRLARETSRTPEERK